MDITLQNVSKSFGDKQVLQGFSHTFPQVGSRRRIQFFCLRRIDLKKGIY